MNATVAKMLGEADYHSAEERAALSQHSETGGGTEEREEVALAKQIVVAAQAGEKEKVIEMAKQLIKMHQGPGPGLQMGTISAQDFLSGKPFRHKRHQPVPGLRSFSPGSKALLMTQAPSQSFPSSP
jgi:hypothetical protein